MRNECKDAMRKYQITPVAKPRMTQRDKWSKRKCVLQYRAFKDQCRLNKVTVTERPWVVFHLPMPPSWSKKKRREMNGKPHQQRPDIDNLIKALLDACLENDSGVFEIHASKVWAIDGLLEVGEM